MRHTFKVALGKGATQHEIAVETPDFDKATDAQRRVLFAEGVDSVTIKVQGSLRRRLEKGVKGSALLHEAQQAWDAIINSRPRTYGPPPVDYMAVPEADRLSKGQVRALQDAGYTFVNLPEGW